MMHLLPWIMHRHPLATPRHPHTGVPVKVAYAWYWCDGARMRLLKKAAADGGHQFHASERHMPEGRDPYWSVTVFKE